MEGGGSVSEECCVCGRQLGVSRWVRGGSQLRHSGRLVAEAVTELLGCEARLSRLCFRCYRLVLGLDYHTHQVHKQKTALLRLYREREKTEKHPGAKTRDSSLGTDGGATCFGPCGSLEKEALDPVNINEKAYEGHMHGDIAKKLDIASGGGDACVLPGNLPQKEVLHTVSVNKGALKGHIDTDRAKEQMLDIAPGGGGVGALVCPCGMPQTEVFDTVSANKEAPEGHTDVDIAEKIDIASGDGDTWVCLCDTTQTEGLEAVIINRETCEGHTDVDTAEEQKLDTASGADYSKHSCDHEYHKNSTVDSEACTPVVPVEDIDLPNITTGGHQEQHNTKRSSLAAKRRKTAKKWDDFEYYEDESKTSEVECEGTEQLLPAHQFRLPLRTGKKKCPECKEEFSTKKAALNHRCCKAKRKEREKVTYTCKGCLHMFLLRREYMKHADACYKNTPVTCNLCLVKLPSAAYLPRHLAALHQVKPSLSKGSILCEACGRGFSRKEALERHEARVHGKAHGSHQCPLCGRTFPHTSLLAEHLRAHQGYTCPECSKVFSCRSNLTLHRRAHHMRKAAYHCTACNKHWKFHASYTYHMKKFHGSTEQRCVRCQVVMYSEEALRQHSMTCCVQDSQSTGQVAAFEDRQGSGREVIKPLPNSSSGCGSLLTPAQLGKKGTDGLVLLSEVRKMQAYQPQNTSHQAPPAGEIIVEVLEDTDADYQYIILVEDAAVAHFTMAETAIWNTSGHQCKCSLPVL